MYLKSIDMQGFKSFAGKTRLEFHDGITGIVGPNGSGKSNVADAVRWVLGEQSAKQLRGGNMQDVIFAGTENRKPLGYASVAITLDNSDHQLKYDTTELTVTRRLYRSGESEYLLNGRTCRLKDINELFYDTGIGKEGYSIIGQGQIDKILSGKPEDRRELFDEAAGIVKFKRRKTASLKKLEQEESNLVRVTDILNELTRQLGPLASQAEKAEQYLAKRDTLREKDIQLFLQESGHTKEQQKELQEKKAIARAQRAEIEENFSRTRHQYDQVEKDLEHLDQQIETNRVASQQAALEKQECEGKINVLREQIRATHAHTEQQQTHVAQAAEELERRKQAQEAEEAEKTALQEKLRTADAEKAEKEAEVQRIQAEIETRLREAEQDRSTTLELLNERSRIKEKIQHYDTMREQTEIRKAELSARMLAMKSEKTAVEEKEAELEAAMAEITEQVTQAEEALRSRQSRAEELQGQLEKDGKAMEEAQAAFHRDASRLESLRNIAERYEGYGSGVKKIMERKTTTPGILGVVAELIKTEERYETAIETALGGSLQHVVLDTEETARDLIAYLKKEKRGRVTFLPLTAVQGRETTISSEVLHENGVLGTADTLIRVESRFQKLAEQLLGKTVVVSSLEEALALRKKHGQALRMVTLEGELLHPGGSLTGGSFQYNSNLLGRKRQLQELEESVQRRKEEIAHLQAQLTKAREERNACREEMAVLTEKLQSLQIDRNTAETNLEAGKERAEALRADYTKLSEERGEIEGQLSEIAATVGLIQEQLQHSEEEERKLEEAIQHLADATEGLQAEEQKAVEAQETARLAYANLRQQCAFVEERIELAKEEHRRSEEEYRQLQENLRIEDGSIHEKEDEIQAMEEQIASLVQKIRQQEEQITSFLAQKEKLNQEHKDFFAQRDALAEQRSQMDQEEFRLEAQEEKLAEAMERLAQYLFEEYQITPDQAQEHPYAELPPRGELKKEISALKAEIRALGDVNVNAVSEYKELKERHDFLSTQHQDLVEAAETLHGIIRELDEGMRKQFREKFTQIRAEFDKVFQELFGGGKGTLELVEGEDILESGIQIISQPPGKKLQNMMQLSGGEKALTAIALLFAIQDLKPSPFCLLDEIEAALDENNVGRFARYLHKLTKNTQFIIITHRRGTMTAADRLYGITMQEKGISAMVSVDLIESQLDA